MSDTTLTSTARELCWLALAGAMLLVPALGGAIGWTAIAVLLWLWLWSMAWRHRGLNRAAADAALFPDLGWATRLTLLRGLLLAALGGFLLQADPDSWWPALCYGAAALLDRLDGEVARRSGRCSELGSVLDTRYDAFGLLLAPLLGVVLGKLPSVYLLTGLAYYLFTVGLRWRGGRGLPVYPLAANRLRRTLAGCQMGFVALALLPPMAATLTQWLGLCFMLPLLLGFLFDWCQVSGRIDPTTAPLAPRLHRLWVLTETLLLLLLRGVLAVAILLLAGEITVLPLPLMIVPAALLCAGFLTRATSTALLVLLCWVLTDEDVDAQVQFCSACAVALLILGGGRFSVWCADDAWLGRV